MEAPAAGVQVLNFLALLVQRYKRTHTDASCLLYWYKSTHTDEEARGSGRYLVYLLYWYKSTQYDEEARGSGVWVLSSSSRGAAGT